MSLFFLSTPIGSLEIVIEKNKLLKVDFSDKKELTFNEGDPEEVEIFNQCQKQLNEYFAGKRFSFDLPIELIGTGFQKQVWSQLTKISYGKTISYRDLAIQLGDPLCIRAAASANGKNPLAVIIPCHRVIGSNGSLTGYAGGLFRKKWLLEHEQKFQRGLQLLF